MTCITPRSHACFPMCLSHRDCEQLGAGTVFAHPAPRPGPGRDEVLTNVPCHPRRVPPGPGSALPTRPLPSMEMEVWHQPKVADKKANRKRAGKQRGRISEMERKQKRKRKWKISPSFLGFLRKGNKSAILTITRKKTPQQIAFQTKDHRRETVYKRMTGRVKVKRPHNRG